MLSVQITGQGQTKNLQCRDDITEERREGIQRTIEVWGHVVTNIHLSQVLVVLHLVIWDADALLSRHAAHVTNS